MHCRFAHLYLVAAFLVVGCGGSGGSPTANGGTHEYGLVQASAVGTMAKPITVAGGSIVTTCLYGATFNEVRVKLPPPTALNLDDVLAQTYLGYESGMKPRLFDYGTQMSYPLADAAWIVSPGFSTPSVGLSRVCFSHYTNDTYSHLFTCNYDGTDLRQITFGTGSQYYPCFNPAGTKIAYIDIQGGSTVWVCDATGANPIKVSGIGQFARCPSWTQDGSLVCYVGYAPSTLADCVWTVAPNGTGAIHAMTVDGGIQALAAGPEGRIYAAVNDQGSYKIMQYNPNIGFTELFPTNGPLSGLAVSPAGGYFAYSRIGDNAGIYVREIGSAFDRKILNGDCYVRSWGPYVQSRTMVSTNSVLGPTASAVLFSQSRTRVTSMLTVAAVTPSSIAVESVYGASSLVFTITGDVLNSLKYMNKLISAPVTVLNTTTTAVGAIVTVSSDTGEVTSVVPYKTAASVVKAGNSLRVTGDILGVWDANGRNTRTSGASEVTVDVTGRVTVVL